MKRRQASHPFFCIDVLWRGQGLLTPPRSSSFFASAYQALGFEIIGTWRCLPEYYPQALVLSGKISLGPFVQTRPMSTIREAFAEAHHTSPEKRILLTPEF